MCSRNGRPIEMFDLPLPSRFSSTRTSVSFVLRRTSASRWLTSGSLLLTLDFIERTQQSIVLFRRTYIETKVILQQRISADIPDEDVALQQLVKNPLFIPASFDYHKVRAGFSQL